jgi:hypothetical protein
MASRVADPDVSMSDRLDPLQLPGAVQSACNGTGDTSKDQD